MFHLGEKNKRISRNDQGDENGSNTKIKLMTWNIIKLEKTLNYNSIASAWRRI